MTTCAEQTIFDSLKNAVIDITNAMRIDFAQEFGKYFQTDEDVRLLRRRLYGRARDIPVQAVIEGYEASLEDGGMPSVDRIIAHANRIAARMRRMERERIEAERIAALPPPNKAGLARIEAERKAASKRAAETDGETHAEKMRRLIEVHEANLRAARAAGKICTPTFAERKTCAVPYCEKAGTMSSSVTGSTMWYCSEHFMARW